MLFETIFMSFAHCLYCELFLKKMVTSVLDLFKVGVILYSHEPGLNFPNKL